jgi:hypothetical protein
MVRTNPGIAAFLYRRICYLRAGPYAEDMQGVEDWLMWASMLRGCGPFVYVPAVLMRYRVHDNRLTTRLAARHQQLKVDPRTVPVPAYLAFARRALTPWRPPGRCAAEDLGRHWWGCRAGCA